MIPAVIAMQRRYRQLNMPVAIFAGTADRIVGYRRHAIRLDQEIPQSTLHLVPDVGHVVHYAVPDQVLDALEAVTDCAKAGHRTGFEREPAQSVPLAIGA